MASTKKMSLKTNGQQGKAEPETACDDLIAQMWLSPQDIASDLSAEKCLLCGISMINAKEGKRDLI